jgi:hypothetical protein
VTGQLCACGCGRPAIPYAEGCYIRWQKAGKPAGGPPAPMTAAQRTARSAATMRAGRDQRLAEYRRLRQRGFTLPQAARRIGVHPNTARDYETRIQREEQPDAA